MKRTTHAQFKLKALAKPSVKKEYDDLAYEFELIYELIQARKAANKSQAEVAKVMKTTTSAISRLESISDRKHHSPSLSTLLRYAKAIGCTLKIKLVPVKKHA